jgi:hypothetical protein
MVLLSVILSVLFNGQLLATLLDVTPRQQITKVKTVSASKVDAVYAERWQVTVTVTNTVWTGKTQPPEQSVSWLS